MRIKLAIIVTIIFSLVYLLFIIDLEKSKLLRLFEIENYKYVYFFYIILILGNLVLFLVPFTATIVLIINGYYFGLYGNLVSLFFILFSASILFFLSKNLIKKKIKFFNKYTKYQKYIDLFDKNKLDLLFGLRFLIPHFFHSIISGFTRINFVKFFIIITMVEIPVIFVLNSIGSSVKSFIDIGNKKIESIFFYSNFYIPFLLIILIYTIYRYFEKKIDYEMKK